MIALYLQTLLLMLAAFLIGATLACLLRRSTRRPAAVDVTGPQGDVIVKDYTVKRPVVPLETAVASSRSGQIADTLVRDPRMAPPATVDVRPVAAKAPEPTVVAVRRTETVVEMPKPVVAPVVVAPVVQTPIVAAPSRVLEPPVVAPIPTMVRPVPQPEPQPVVVRSAAVEPAPVVAPQSATVAAMAATAMAAAAAAKAIEMAKAAAPVSAPPAVVPVAPVTAAPVVAAPVAVEPVVVAPVVVAPVPTTPVVAAAIVAGPDDLKRIQAISPQIETSLRQLGVDKFKQIAGWQRNDVERVNGALGFRNRVEQENWIEQAKILSDGGTTSYARDYARGLMAPVIPVAIDKPLVQSIAAPQVAAPVVPVSKPVADAAVAAAAAVATAMAAARAPKPATELEVKAPSAPIDTPRVAERAAFAVPVAIERAVATAPTPVAPVVVAASVAAPVAASVPPPQAPSGIARATTALPATAQTPAPLASTASMATTSRDELERIRTINGEVAKVLSVHGITRYGQIANWTQPDVERFDQLLGAPGRIDRESWIEQAKILGAGGATDYSRTYDNRAFDRVRGLTPPAATVPAPPPAPDQPTISAQQPAPPVTQIVAPPVSPPVPNMTQGVVAAGLAAATAAAQAAMRPANLGEAIQQRQTIETATPIVAAQAPATVATEARAPGLRQADLSSLVSVKSPVLRDPNAGPQGIGGAGRMLRSAQPEDLKRIRGVGVLIEKRLNALGVTHYEHIANWTSVDIDRFNTQLDFKGRIERESWVEQARILSSGGQTEFSRRLDRGGS